MEWPKFIRELVGAFNAYKDLIKKDLEWEKIHKPMFDWLIDKLVYKVIEGWYKNTKQTDPTLLTKEGVRKHVHWWPSWRKEEEFFDRNKAANINEIDADLRSAFKEQFPEGDLLDFVYSSRDYDVIEKAVKAKIRKEIF